MITMALIAIAPAMAFQYLGRRGETVWWLHDSGRLHGHPGSASTLMHERRAGNHRGSIGSIDYAPSRLTSRHNATQAHFAPFIVSNNLGGQGPDEDSPDNIIAIGDVAELGKNKTPVTIVFTNLTDYVPGEVSKNGLFDELFPAVNVHSNSSVTIRAEFVDGTTGSGVTLRYFGLTFLNLDTNIDGTGVQEVISYGHADYHVSEETSLNVTKTHHGGLSFTATVPNEKHSSVGKPFTMTEEEQAMALALVWKNVDHIEFTLQVNGLSDDPPGRIFKMGGLSELIPGALERVDPASGLQVTEKAPTGGNFIFLLIAVLLVILLLIVIFVVCVCRSTSRANAPPAAVKDAPVPQPTKSSRTSCCG
eukprot:TRINITY_DN6425_c0_g2_i2.p1 TRINITY_DN6425_c0_g2~~TRINITY_DN6425_c0_g2_i2.p1  ORF type:complete len:363 (+),score=46.12 TRINITY_DN6425_c0_g2_i2:108-1196(+)